jgi:hypothetical protein
MGFLSFGKKKKADSGTLPSPPPKPLSSRLSRNHASPTSTLSATSSGSSSGSPPQPQKPQPPIAHPEPLRRSLSFAPEHLHRPSSASALPQVPPIPTSAIAASSSNSLNIPKAPDANRALAKKASTNTLNSMKGTKRGPHSAPPLADCLAKPRSASYHAPHFRNIWATSEDHSMIAANSAVNPRNSNPTVSRSSYYGYGAYHAVMLGEMCRI